MNRRRSILGIPVYAASVVLLAGATIGASAESSAPKDSTSGRPSATSDTPAPATKDAQEKLPPSHLREGATVTDLVGHFKAAGDRWVFFEEGNSRRLIALENQNLERLSRTMAESPLPLVWKVTGTITEFRGKNYLLIERAVLRGTAERSTR